MSTPVRVFPRRVVLAFVPAVRQEDLVPAVPLVRAQRVGALGPGTVVFDVDRLVRRFPQPVRRLVVVVETEGARPEQAKCIVEREVLVPVGVRTVDVVQDGAAVDAVLVSGDVSGRGQVVVQQPGLVVELDGRVRLLHDVAVEKRPVEGHVVYV